MCLCSIVFLDLKFEGRSGIASWSMSLSIRIRSVYILFYSSKWAMLRLECEKKVACNWFFFLCFQINKWKLLGWLSEWVNDGNTNVCSFVVLLVCVSLQQIFFCVLLPILYTICTTATAEMVVVVSGIPFFFFCFQLFFHIWSDWQSFCSCFWCYGVSCVMFKCSLLHQHSPKVQFLLKKVVKNTSLVLQFSSGVSIGAWCVSSVEPSRA